MASPPRRSKRVKRHAQQTGTSAHENNSERMFDALTAGAVTFLGLRESVAALSTCRLLRQDATLAIMALSHTYAGAHLLHGCARDWMQVLSLDAPQKQHVEFFLGECHSKECRRRTGESTQHRDRDEDNGAPAIGTDMDELQQQEGHMLRSEGDAMNHALLADPRIGKNGRYATQLLSLVGMIQEHLLPLCYSFTGLNAFGDLCSARPVLIPLAECSQSSGSTEVQSAAKWTLDDVKRALNAKWNLLGDDFTSPASTYVHVSDVGAHWENISMSKRNGKPSCAFCDAAKKAVREYRREASAMLKKFNEVLGTKKLKWRAEGFDAEEIHQKRSELKARFFPEDSYPDVNFADSHDDDILADICESERFPMNPFEGLATGFDRANDDVFNALSEQYMGLCKSLYQPLKRALTEQLAFVGRRVHRSWMNDDDGIVLSELVAGVSSSGFLCGVFIIVKKAEYEAPHSVGLDEE